MRQFLALIKGHTKVFAAALLALTLASIFNSAITVSVKPLVDQVLTSPKQKPEEPSRIDQIFQQNKVLNEIGDWLNEQGLSVQDLSPGSPELDLTNPLPWAVMVFILFLIQAIFDFVGSYTLGRIGLQVVVDLRQKLIETIMSLSMRFFEIHSSGEILSRINTDVLKVQQAISTKLGEFIKESANIFVFTILALILNWKLSLFLFILVPLIGWPLGQLSRRIRRYANHSQDILGGLTSRLKEVLVGIRIIKSFGKEEFENRRLKDINKNFFKIALRELLIVNLTSPITSVTGIMVILTFVCYGSISIQQGLITPGEFLAYVLVVYSMYQPVKRIARANAEIQQAVGVLPRISHILSWQNDIEETSKPQRFEGFPNVAQIQFDHVSFAYPDEPDKYVLQDIQLDIVQGDVIALVGTSGGGKTSLVNLLPRFYDVTKGCIKFNQVDIRQMAKRDLRDLIAVVTQNTILFDDTVFSNIAYGMPDATPEQVEDAAKKAFAHDFIQKLPKGYLTTIGEAGDKLSGGQRQRLSIARAILKDSPILILDEATSALDTESEREVQLALDYLMQRKTTFVVAHRLSTISRATKILVLAAGQIVEQGTHLELIEKGGVYRKLVNMQEERLNAQ